MGGQVDTISKHKDQGKFSATKQHTRLRMTMRQNKVRNGSVRGRHEEPKSERTRIQESKNPGGEDEFREDENAGGRDDEMTR